MQLRRDCSSTWGLQQLPVMRECYAGVLACVSTAPDLSAMWAAAAAVAQPGSSFHPHSLTVWDVIGRTGWEVSRLLLRRPTSHETHLSGNDALPSQWSAHHQGGNS